MLAPLMNKILDVASKSTGAQFECILEALQKMYDTWATGEEVDVISLDRIASGESINDNSSSTAPAELLSAILPTPSSDLLDSQETSTQKEIDNALSKMQVTLETLELPVPVKQRGHPRGSTITFRSSKKG